MEYCGIENPSGVPIEDYRVARDIIKDKIID